MAIGLSRGSRNRIRRTQVSESCLTTQTVEVLARGHEQLACACGQGALALEVIQLEGKRALPAGEFLRGYMPIVGARLGSAEASQ